MAKYLIQIKMSKFYKGRYAKNTNIPSKFGLFKI